MPNHKRILLVDDDPTVRQSLEIVLGAHGYEVTSAEDGNHGWDLYQQSQPDLLVLDMMMPRDSGFVMLSHLQHSNSRTPVIMITGSPMKRYEEYAAKLGVKAFFNKPFPMDFFVTAVERNLN